MRTNRVFPVIGIALLLFAAAPVGATATKGGRPAPEEFTGVLLTKAGGATVLVTLHVDSYTTADEVGSLARTLGHDGQHAVVAALAEMKPRGWIRVGDVIGFEVPIIRSFTTEKGTRIFAVLDRPFPIWEQLQGTHSPDYPYGMVELKFGLDGDGKGTLVSAGRAMFTDDGKVEMLGYGGKPYPIIGVTQQTVAR